MKPFATTVSCALLLLFVACTPGNSAKTKTQYVTARSGLTIRAQPGQGAKRIGALRYGTAVTVLDHSKGYRVIAGRRGRWVKIKHEGKTGWVFDGYLSLVKPEQPAAKKQDSKEAISVAVAKALNQHTKPASALAALLKERGELTFQYGVGFSGSTQSEYHGTLVLKDSGFTETMGGAGSAEKCPAGKPIKTSEPVGYNLTYKTMRSGNLSFTATAVELAFTSSIRTTHITGTCCPENKTGHKRVAQLDNKVSLPVTTGKWQNELRIGLQDTSNKGLYWVLIR